MVSSGKFIYNFVLAIIISFTVLSSTFAAIQTYDNFTINNDQKILNSFIYFKLNECIEKLGAYGEAVDFDIKFNDSNAEELSICIEKLLAYGEPIDKNTAALR